MSANANVLLSCTVQGKLPPLSAAATGFTASASLQGYVEVSDNVAVSDP